MTAERNDEPMTPGDLLDQVRRILLRDKEGLNRYFSDADENTPQEELFERLRDFAQEKIDQLKPGS